MLKKVVSGFLVFAASSLFAMSLEQLNSASMVELMEINGIGEAKASAILKERKQGKFKSFEDLQRVNGIGEQTSANVKNDVKHANKKKSTKKTTSSKKDTKKKS